MKNCRVTNGAVITMKLISITISIVQKPIAIFCSDYADLVKYYPFKKHQSLHVSHSFLFIVHGVRVYADWRCCSATDLI